MTFGNYCTVKRTAGRIVLEIPEEEMLRYFLGRDPEFPLVDPADREIFMQRLAEALPHIEKPTGDDQFTTWLEEWIKAAAHRADE